MGTSFQPLLRQVGGNGVWRSHPFLGGTMTLVNKNWSNPDGTRAGGVSYGPGFCVSWQRGPLTEGRNGAFLIEVLEACESQLAYYQDSKFTCQENADALNHLNAAISTLQSRRDRRFAEGKLGTTEV